MFSLAKRLLIPAAVLLPLACSSGASDHGGAGGEVGDEPRIVPEDLTVMSLPGASGVLKVVALTLRRGPTNTELYAALQNDGDIHACNGVVNVELYDRSQVSLAAGVSGLYSQRFYRRTDDGSGTITACVSPGDVSMAAVTSLPSDLVIEDVGYVLYRCHYYAIDVAPIDGLSIGQVKAVARDAGTAYTGTLFNGFDVPLSNPSATVFSLSRAGRPLGVAIASDTVQVPPGSSWAFETNTVDTPGPDHAAYPSGDLVTQ